MSSTLLLHFLQAGSVTVCVFGIIVTLLLLANVPPANRLFRMGLSSVCVSLALFAARTILDTLSMSRLVSYEQALTIAAALLLPVGFVLLWFGAPREALGELP